MRWMPSAAPRPRTSLLVLAGWLAAVIAVTWPLAARASFALPWVLPYVGYDTLYASWVLSWVSRTLVTDPLRLASANVYHPDPAALFYGPTAFGALPLFAPAFLATGSVPVGVAAVLVGGLTLTTWGVHRVVVRWTGRESAGLVAGAACLASPWLVDRWASTPPYVVLGAMPWIAWRVAAGVPTRAAVVVLALLIAQQALVDPLPYAVGAMLPVALVGVARVVRRPHRRDGLRVLAAVVLAVAVMLPVYAGYAVVRGANPDLAYQSVWSGPLDPAVTSAFEAAGPFLARLPAESSLPRLAAAALGLVLAVRRSTPAAAAWAVAGTFAAVGFLGSLLGTPAGFLFMFGRLGALRTLMRIHADAVVAVPLLLGLSFAEIAGRCTRTPSLGRLAPAALAVAAVAALGWQAFGDRRGPFRTIPQPAPAAALLPQLRGGSGPLLELPASLTDPAPNARAMYRSTFHWRPLLNGYSSYYPAGFPARMALAAQLPDRAALTALVRDTGLEMVLVRFPELTPQAVERWRDIPRVRASGLDPVGRTPHEWLFAVSPSVRFDPAARPTSPSPGR